MMNPWLLLGALAAFVASVTGAFFYGQNVGAEDERAEWQDRENVELSAANKRIIELTETARAQESEHAVELHAISAKYQEDLQNEKIKSDAVVSDVRAGIIRLRDPGSTASRACGGEAGKAAASASGRDGEAGGELPSTGDGILSVEAAEFIVRIASEADDIVRQLSACQKVIETDREKM